MKWLSMICVFFSVSAHALDFEGRWNVDKVECVDSGNGLVAFPDTLDVRCSEPIEEFNFSYNSVYERIEERLLKTTESGHNVWLRNMHSTFTKMYYGPHRSFPSAWGRLSVADDRVTYSENKVAYIDDGSIYSFSMELKKLSANRYKLVRKYKYKHASYFGFEGKHQDVTQTLYLSR
jgi:hypothetical protein